MEKNFINRHLDGSSFLWKGSSTTGILLLHGFAATTVEVRGLAKYLHECGYTVCGPLLPGHGTTIDDLNTKKWQNWTNAAEDALAKLGKSCQQVFVGGESMGGLISLYLAARSPHLHGLLLYAPALNTPHIGWASILSTFLKYLPPSSVDENTPWQGYAGRPLNATSELASLQKVVRKLLPEVNQPALIYQGREDRTIDPNSSQMVYDGIASQDRHLQWLEHIGHCILLNSALDQVAAESLAFIQAHES